MREIPYGLEAKIFSRKRGESAVAKAAYRAGKRLIDQRTGEVFDFTKKSHVEFSQILAPASAPGWVFDRSELWNRGEQAETRKDAQVAREIRLTLPRELDRENQIKLVREWVGNEYVSRGMVADFAIHAPDASDGNEQPHAHIMLTLRPLDPMTESGFAAKKGRTWNADFAGNDAFKYAKKGDKPNSVFVADTAGLEGMRERWAALENRYLAAAGIDGRVDHRTLKAQHADAVARGDLEAAARLDRPPEPKLRPGEKGRKSERAEVVADLRQHRAEIVDLAAERQRRKPGATPDPAPRPRQRRDQSAEAVARRRERKRRVEEARGRQSRFESLNDAANQAAKDRYKLQLLQQQYGEMPANLAGNLAWVRARPGAGETVVQLRDGGRIRDDGAALRSKGESGSAMAVMVAAAQAHGWTEIDISTGSKAFRERSAEALTRAGIAVKNADLAAVVEKTKAAMAAEAPAEARAFVRQQVAEAERQLANSRRIAEARTWLAPDGRRRDLPVRLSEAEIRHHLQPEGQRAREDVAALRRQIAERQAAYATINPLSRAFGFEAGRRREEIEKLKTALTEAQEKACAADTAYSRMGAQIADLKRQCEQRRDAAKTACDTAAENAKEHGERARELRNLSRTLDAMIEAGELQAPPPNLNPAQRLEMLKEQAEAWAEKQNAADPGPRHSAGPRMGR